VRDDATDVLIVEDRPDVAAVVGEVLAEDPRLRVVATAGNAEAGVAALRDREPDVVVLDALLKSDLTDEIRLAVARAAGRG
jgi:DNA-binding NarL/FixJ family response regulator